MYGGRQFLIWQQLYDIINNPSSFYLSIPLYTACYLMFERWMSQLRFHIHVQGRKSDTSNYSPLFFCQ